MSPNNKQLSYQLLVCGLVFVQLLLCKCAMCLCDVSDVLLRLSSPVDVGFLHHSFHSVIELKESHVLRGKDKSQRFIFSTQYSCMSLKYILKEI